VPHSKLGESPKKQALGPGNNSPTSGMVLQITYSNLQLSALQEPE